jgi:hypothetical protein
MRALPGDIPCSMFHVAAPTSGRDMDIASCCCCLLVAGNVAIVHIAIAIAYCLLDASCLLLYSFFKTKN